MRCIIKIQKFYYYSLQFLVICLLVINYGCRTPDSKDIPKEASNDYHNRNTDSYRETKQTTQRSSILKQKYGSTKMRNEIDISKAITHIVKVGETLSEIAMDYYGTYLTKIFYEPEGERYMVSEVIEKVNGIQDSKKLCAGQKLILPLIESLPFINHKKENNNSGTNILKDKEKREDHQQRPLAKKTMENISQEIYVAINFYHNAVFEKAKNIFQLNERKDNHSKDKQIALVYLSLIEIAYGNIKQADEYILKLLLIDNTIRLEDIKKIIPSLSDDVTPVFEQRFYHIKKERF